MNSRARNRAFGVAWLVALALAACTSDRLQGAQEAAQDTLYDGLSAEAALAARQAVQTALETRRSEDTYRWRLGNGGSGSVTPLRTFRIKTGHFCRDYSETIANSPQPVSAMRTACRGDQGTWRVVKR